VLQTISSCSERSLACVVYCTGTLRCSVRGELTCGVGWVLWGADYFCCSCVGLRISDYDLVSVSSLIPLCPWVFFFWLC